MKKLHLFTSLLALISFLSVAQVDHGLDQFWFTDFSGPMVTTEGAINANCVVVSGSSVYVGGGFSKFAGHDHKGITRWDGSKWNDVGGGLNGEVNVMLVAPNGDLYVGGKFTTTADGATALNRIAKWDGVEWSDLDGGFGINIFGLAMDEDGNLYAGGGNNTGPSNIFKWNGADWTDIGGVVTSIVNNLVYDNGILYAGGFFTHIGGVDTKNIASWDGANWHSLDGGVTAGDRIYGMTTLNGDLYVTGNFTSIGGVTATNLAKWNGTDWSPVGDGLPQIEFAIGTTPDGKIWARGGGYSPSVVSTIATWDGASWTQTGITVNSVNGVAFDGNATYIAGAFGLLNSDFGMETYYSSGIIKTVGSKAYPLSEDLTNPVQAIATVGSDVYVAGNFARMDAQDEPFNSIAKWDGNTWSRVGAGLTIFGGRAGNVNALAVEGNNIYAGGYLQGGVQQWNGTEWKFLGTGVAATGGIQISALAVKNGIVYAGGDIYAIFKPLEMVQAKSIAVWDGIDWNPLGAGLNGTVYSILIDGDDVYAGGAFTKSGEADVQYFARWDGQTWHQVGSGLDGAVRSIIKKGNDFYLAGEFGHAGGLTVNRIAKWNGSFSAVGLGFDNTVRDIEAIGPHIYATGDFMTAGGAPAKRIAQWDGSNWSPIGAGLHGPFSTLHHGAVLATMEGVVWVGGNFMEAGSHGSAFLAGLHTDGDGDDIADVVDNCPNTHNPTQVNGDGDTSGLGCDCDDNDAAVSAKIWFHDGDGDGLGKTNEKIVSCTQPAGYVALPADCDDTDPDSTSPTSWFADGDGDGFGNAGVEIESCFKPVGYVDNSLDCNDANNTLSPNTLWYRDADGDGFGALLVTQAGCTQPSGYVNTSTDCDDTKADINPNTKWYTDNDDDGFAASGAGFITSCVKPAFRATVMGDCDDTSSTIFPGATKLPNGKDNDCDGVIELFDQVLTFAPIAPRIFGVDAALFSPPVSSNATGAGLTLETASTHVTIGGLSVNVVSAGSVTLTLKSAAFLGWRAAQLSQTFCINLPKPVISTSTGSTLSLTSNLLSGNQWLKDGVAVPNATGLSYVPTEAGVYSARGEVEGCIGEVSNSIPVIVTWANQTAEKPHLYPNPVTEILYIYVGPQDAAVSVLCLDGREISNTKASGTVEVNMSGSASGMYMVKVVGDEGVFVSRFLKR